MSTRLWWVIIAALLVVIAVLAWLLLMTPSAASAPSASAPEDWSATSTSDGDTSTNPSTPPLDTNVSVSSPKSGAIVSHTFTISGNAPNTWYFEAVFPIKVTTPAGDTVGTAQGRAQTDWTVEGQVPFTATVSITSSYSGPATVALLRDNPSGLPENDDSFEVPVIIQ